MLELDGAEAADWFAKKYLPDLRKVSVRFPEEWLSSGTTIQFPDLPQDKLNILLKQVEIGEKNAVGSFMGNVTGTSAEHEVWTYLTQISQSTRTALLSNYNTKMFYTLFGLPEKQAEFDFDFLLIVAEYKIVVCLEVQANPALTKFLKYLKKGEDFYHEVLAAIGEDEYKDWEYIPVAVFPYAVSRNEVREREVFFRRYPNVKIVTRQEMNQPGSFIDLLHLPKKFPIDESYIRLVKVLMASAHCSSPPLNMIEETKKKLIGLNTPDLGVGISQDPWPPSSKVPFFSLRGKPVGSVESIIFWNKEQAQFLFQDTSNIILSGEFGSGQTTLLFSKVKSMLERGLKVVFISCLLPWEGVSPIYNVLMRQEIENIGGMFYSAQDICQAKKTAVTEVDFYSLLVQFVQERQVETRSTIIIDKFGDNMMKTYNEEKKNMNKMLLLEVVKSLSEHGQAGAQLTISIHPHCEFNDFDFKDLGFKHVQLNYVLRITASIYGYEQAMQENSSDVISSSVIGPSPVYITSNGDDFYGKTLDAVSGKTRKFVLLSDTDRFDGANYDKVKAELDKLGIEIFEYLTLKDNMKNLERFLKAEEGCLITNYKCIREVECSALVVFTEDLFEKEDSRILRATIFLVVAILKKVDPLTVNYINMECSNHHLFMKGSVKDPSLYSRIVEELLERKIEKYILLIDTVVHTSKRLFLEQLMRQGVNPPDIAPKLDTPANLEIVRISCEESSKGAIYTRAHIEEECVVWFARNNIPLIYFHQASDNQDIQRILSNKPKFFIQVNYV